jgi:hypothetical protein
MEATIPDPPESSPETEGPSDTLPRARAVVTNAATATEWLRAEMGRNALSCLFRRSGDVVHTPRIGEDGYKAPTKEEQERGHHNGPAQIRAVTAAHVQALVDVRYKVVRERVNKETGEVKDTPALFPVNAAASAYNAATLGENTPNLKELRGITHTPVLRPDGTVLAEPGYDDATGLLYLPTGGLTVPAIPGRPTSEQVRAAVAFVLKPVAQFPFVSDRHRANWAAMIMTPLLRTVLPPSYPLFVVSAHNPGSGKTLLVKLAGIVHGMVTRPEFPSDKEEQRKAIGAVLSDTTAPIVLFDNLSGVIRSSTLEGLLTSPTFSDRLLGTQKSLTLPNDRVWAGTGNNVKVGGDLPRRTYDIVIKPEGPDPYLRSDFDIPNLEVWMTEQRGEYIAALLTIARAWAVAGMPTEKNRSDNFADWDGAMRGLIRFAGISETFGQDRESGIGAVSEDDADWAAFLAAVHRVFGDQPFMAKAVIKEVGEEFSESTPKISPEMLPGDLAEKWSRSPDGVAKSLGRWFSNREGRYASGYRVELHSESKSGKRYRVIPPPDQP